MKVELRKHKFYTFYIRDKFSGMYLGCNVVTARTTKEARELSRDKFLKRLVFSTNREA